jgi:hypothetical protein
MSDKQQTDKHNGLAAVALQLRRVQALRASHTKQGGMTEDLMQHLHRQRRYLAQLGRQRTREAVALQEPEIAQHASKGHWWHHIN